MGGFRFVGETPLALTFVDLATGDEVTALNIGSATLLEEGDCAIGRLVPIEGGAMFESAPLFVPDAVAQQVADDPADWVAALAAGCERVGRRVAPEHDDAGVRHGHRRAPLRAAPSGDRGGVGAGEEFTVKELTATS